MGREAGGTNMPPISVENVGNRRQRGYDQARTGLGESENVIDEQQRILNLLIREVRVRRFVHLGED